jgi:EAL domain-containing protein (putative c-di-GMP-specific phosphodiesterase class I)
MADQLNVLAVDDNAALLGVLQEVLDSAGYSTQLATRSTEALDLVSQKSFDVAIVDYDMPPPNGLELLKQLREVQPRCVRILMSGRLDMPALIDAVNRGEVTRVLEKPFRSPDLIDAIKQAIEARKRMEESLVLQGEDAQKQLGSLEECLGGDYIQLAVQPIVRASDRNIEAFEALIRSTHPVLDNPLAVLQAAEALNRVQDVGDVVAARAAGWLEKLPDSVLLFMNLHPAELGDPKKLEARLESLQPWASNIVLEITERTRLLEVEAWETSVQRMTDMGFALAVDDLGAGYNSLAVLAELQPNFLKIDMSIVRNVNETPRKQRLIELLCRFAETTNAKLIAEGVETEPEAAALLESGAHLLQG